MNALTGFVGVYLFGHQVNDFVDKYEDGDDANSYRKQMVNGIFYLLVALVVLNVLVFVLHTCLCSRRAKANNWNTWTNLLMDLAVVVSVALLIMAWTAYMGKFGMGILCTEFKDNVEKFVEIASKTELPLLLQKVKDVAGIKTTAADIAEETSKVDGFCADIEELELPMYHLNLSALVAFLSQLQLFGLSCAA